MQVTVSGKHLDVGTTLSSYAQSELESTVTKYFERAVSAHITFAKERHVFYVDILVNEGTGNHVLIKGRGEGSDAHAAFDKTLYKIERQLSRYKHKIRGYHKARIGKEMQHNSVFNGTKYVIPYNEHSAEEPFEEKNGAPLIIAEKPTKIETLSVSDAVMRMDLGELPALMFINKKTSTLNVIYRRTDGNISWIDSSSIEKTAIAS